MEPIAKTIHTVDWITLILFSSVLFVVIAKSLFYGRFLNFIILPFNNKYIFMYNKKDKLLNWFHVFFTIFQLLNYSLFIYLAREILLNAENIAYSYVYPIILVFLILFLLIKILLQLGNGFVFNNGKIITEFIFKKLSYFNYSAFIVFLANVILTYVFIGSKTVVFTSIFLIVLINAVGWFMIIKNHQKYITSHFFYFILYLCALEIAPFVIIVNYL
ncbi:DUF4271 domain-containing protein [Muriicola sp. Z0-33]|uniref:DUF4271 domain-containing protein n=1 Tax=Muriicola sp. Z0-33 TaxID=2816957 RepID=UPI00223730CF|nr:DUF4271 domain-containing protein [Muriicola sp. Z0-33]MCW5515020.1 DUF4271 domain-containing protein [Muriicola sp. Z0-33]